LSVQSDEYVTVEVDGVRPICYQNVKVRVSESYRLEMHIDTDEANAGFITQGAIGHIRCTAEERPSLKELVENTKKTVKNHYNYQKKLLSNDDVRAISEVEIVIEKGTIVTALARDTARELGKSISIRN
jgi:putative phosphotransacetylase